MAGLARRAGYGREGRIEFGVVLDGRAEDDAASNCRRAGCCAHVIERVTSGVHVPDRLLCRAVCHLSLREASLGVGQAVRGGGLRDDVASSGAE